MTTFRNNLKIEIKKLGGTKSLAEKMNYSTSGLSRLLNGERKFNESHFELISKALKKPISSLFQSEEEIALKHEQTETNLEYKMMIEIMDLVPSIRKIMLGKFTELSQIFANEIRSAKSRKSS